MSANDLDRSLVLDAVRVTEAAALAAYRWEALGLPALTQAVAMDLGRSSRSASGHLVEAALLADLPPAACPDLQVRGGDC